VPGAVISIFALVSFAAPWLAARDVESATGSWRRNPNLAFDRLEQARRLDPLSERPDLVAGAIASRLGDWERMRASFTRARDRNPQSWYAELELAVVDGLEGRRSAALRHLERARELNPREPAIADAERQLLSGRPIRPVLLDRMLLGRFDARETDRNEARNLRND
jgi:tetratricopeptide (TPR) repeat protein